MNPPTLTIISFGQISKEFLTKISDAVTDEFSCQVLIRDGHIDLSEFYDPHRRQYNGDKLLREVDSINNPGTGKTIGLFNVDLFIPILTYIFGQAQLGGQTAIASQYRLSNERYGMPADDNILLERFKKEVIHELGHTFGLIHCHTPTCVMRSSTYVEDIDQKEEQLCAKCMNILHRSGFPAF
jgi:archaemetzincin